jgi:ubiquinone/menaquinone biosynthesis C-methylase UbiE
MSFDAAQFKRLERAGYNKLGPRYLASAAPRQAIADARLAAAALAPGQVVLDLCSGPDMLGRVAAKVVSDAGLVIASDIAEAQLACCPDLMRVAADGEVLPFGAARFNRILCGLGLMIFPDTDRALNEMHRVLRHDGLLALSVWGTADEVPLIECALSCIRRLLPPPKVTRPSVFRFGEVNELERRLASADFSAISIRPIKFSASFRDAQTFWQAFLDLAGGAAESLSRLPPKVRQRLISEVAQELAPFAVSGGYLLHSTVLVATARRL